MMEDNEGGDRKEVRRGDEGGDGEALGKIMREVIQQRWWKR